MPVSIPQTYQTGSFGISNALSQYAMYQVNNNVLAPANTPFTVEAWVYGIGNATGNINQAPGIWSSSNTATTGHMTMFMGHNGLYSGLQWGLYWQGISANALAGGGGAGSTTNLLTSLSPFTPNVWNHVAVVRSGTTNVTMFINGAYAGNASTTQAIQGGQTWYIGTAGNGGTTTYFNGYVSNFRLVIGTAIYTGPFTPPTGSLPAGQFDSPGANIVAFPTNQCQLLLKTPANNNFAYDSSPNNFWGQLNGSPSYSTQSPFTTQSTGWTMTVDPLGSLSLNGSTQYVSAASSTGFAFGSGVDFTVEAWIYMTSYSGSIYGSAIGTTNGAQTGWMLNFGEGTDRYRIISNASGTWTDNVTCSAGNGIVLNTWTHVAMVRNGANLYLFKDGAIVGSIAGASAYNFTAPSNLLNIGYTSDGSSGTRYFPGYISNVRVVKGVAVYTGTFTVPTAPLQVSQPGDGGNISAVLQSQVSLLLNTPGNSNFLKDTSPQNVTATNNGSIVANTTTPFTKSNSITINVGGPNNPPPTVEYLVVGGGGGGGSFGGGGGAGGYLTATGFVVPTGNSSLTVTVGAGGTGGQHTIAASAGNGVASSLAASTTITAAGGGYGGSRDTPGYTAGAAGGSGGGGSSQSNPGGAGNTPSTSPSQGNAGGAGGVDGGSVIDYPSGGGGGAGAAGQAGVQDQESGYGGGGNISTIITSFVGTGSITSGSTTLTVSAVTTGEVDVGTQITGSGIPAAQSSSITSITWATNIVTVNFTTGPTFAVDMLITLSGTTGAVYDGIFKVTAVPGGGTSIQFASTLSTGQAGAGGTISSATTYITALGTGTGSTGTYVMNNPATATTTGVALTSSGTYFAGGGGGSTFSTLNAGSGGAGGGGAGSNTQSVNGTAGATNTGGGGGGGGYLATGGAGGSGKVIVRYADTYDAPISAPGASVNVAGGYRVYQFNTSGSMAWNPTALTYVEYIVVGGGGGGGYGGGALNQCAGGGGGGGLVTGIFQVLSGLSASVTVGGGGSAGTVPSTASGSGSPSSFTYNSKTITGLGGGAGMNNGTTPGSSGGSGGGANGTATQPTSASGGFGNAGGPSNTGSGYGAGGGGAGATANGTSASLASGYVGAEAGGVGKYIDSFNNYGTTFTNSTAPSTGKGWFGGGGGGGAWPSAANNTPGGAGGGGTGVSGSAGQAGTAGTINTGGGGGGGQNNTAASGGAGGSGVVIFRYPSGFGTAVSTTGTVSTTELMGFRYYAFTAGSGTIQFI